MASFEAKARASRQCHQQNHRRGLLSAGAASRRSQNALWCQSQRSCGRRGSVANKTQSATSTPWQEPAYRRWHRVMASFETKTGASRQCHQQNHRRGLLSAGAASRRSQNALWCQSQRSCGRRGSVANKTQSATSTPWQGPTYRWGASRCGIVRGKSSGITTVSPTKP